MWNDLSYPWQEAFTLAWQAYGRGTIPIGAVIVDAEEHLVSRGRNRIYEESGSHSLAGTNLAHAEMDALIQLKAAEHPEVRSYTLYSTMEPCPMCFGAAVMANIRNINYAAKDSFAGATVLAERLDYIKSKNMNITYVGGEMGAFHLILHTAYECMRNPYRRDELFAAWRQVNSRAVDLGEELFSGGYFQKALESGKDIATIYDEVLTLYHSGHR